ATVVVERQLELHLIARKCEEVVCRFQLAVANDGQLTAELHPERLVERAAALGISDAVHGVEIAGHRLHPRRGRPTGPRRKERTLSAENRRRTLGGWYSPAG